jgi:polysaccharide biosynthesis transport protein
VTFRDYLLILRRRKWILGIVVLLVPAVTVLVSLRQEHRYEAAAEVLLSRESPGDLLGGVEASGTQAERIVATEANVARVPAIAARTLTAAGASELGVREFLADSSVSPKSNTDILAFKVVASSPQLAVRLAREYATQFLAYRRTLDSAAFESARNAVRRSIDRLELADRLRPGGERQGSGQPLGRLSRSAVYASLLEKEQELRAAEALLDSRFVLIRAPDDAELVSPRPLRNGLLGLALGLLLGIGLACLREALDTGVRSGAEVASHLRLPLLARLPGGLARDGRLAMLAQPDGAEAEAFRVLRTNLELLLANARARAIMVTSGLEGEGKSTTVANLGLALARTGRRVALVDLNFRHPSLARLFDVHARAGVTDVVFGHLRLETAVTAVPPFGTSAEPLGGNGRSAVSGSLEVLTAGSIQPEPGELLGQQALVDLLQELRDRADLVLVDAPALLGVGDAIALAARVDALLLVASPKLLRRPVLGEVRRILDACPGAKLGIVVTGTAPVGAFEDLGMGVDGLPRGHELDWQVATRAPSSFARSPS